jgi:hypothetical protein
MVGCALEFGDVVRGILAQHADARGGGPGGFAGDGSLETPVAAIVRGRRGGDGLVGGIELGGTVRGAVEARRAGGFESRLGERTGQREEARRLQQARSRRVVRLGHVAGGLRWRGLAVSLPPMHHNILGSGSGGSILTKGP